MQVNKQNKGQKSDDQLYRCRKSLWGNSASISDKSPVETRNRRTVTQNNI
jgi:hypothetical protein